MAYKGQQQYHMAYKGHLQTTNLYSKICTTTTQNLFPLLTLQMNC